MIDTTRLAGKNDGDGMTSKEKEFTASVCLLSHKEKSDERRRKTYSFL